MVVERGVRHNNHSMYPMFLDHMIYGFIFGDALNNIKVHNKFQCLEKNTAVVIEVL
jgi:hypothetical protein